MCHLTNLSFPLFVANYIEEEAKHQPKKEEGEPKIAVVRGGAEGAGVLREHERQQRLRLRPDVHHGASGAWTARGQGSPAHREDVACRDVCISW